MGQPLPPRKNQSVCTELICARAKWLHVGAAAGFVALGFVLLRIPEAKGENSPPSIILPIVLFILVVPEGRATIAHRLNGGSGAEWFTRSPSGTTEILPLPHQREREIVKNYQRWEDEAGSPAVP